MNGNEIIKRLKAEGWGLKRIRGSHHMLKKDGRVVPVPVHPNPDKPEPKRDDKPSVLLMRRVDKR
jgi:predicted RNA binding protein YcfA (HicA-like mRNA interferase family)